LSSSSASFGYRGIAPFYFSNIFRLFDVILLLPKIDDTGLDFACSNAGAV
tara:strand:- start:282 stop:431 length:150 start_codon:yes stop_codon:yes gene_type:complete